MDEILNIKLYLRSFPFLLRVVCRQCAPSVFLIEWLLKLWPRGGEGNLSESLATPDDLYTRVHQMITEATGYSLD